MLTLATGPFRLVRREPPIAGVMALERIGIDTTIITSSIQIRPWHNRPGRGLAFGLGGQTVAAEIIKNPIATARKQRA